MKCPGQDSRYWKIDAISEVPCPKCGKSVEFFKDENTRKCDHCGHRFVNPNMDFGCAAYCKYAEQCVGGLPEDILAKRSDLLKDRVAIEMKRYFKRDFKRIAHAMRVARHAEAIGKQEDCDMAVVLIAAYLHDIGIHEAEKKYQSTAPKYQEKEGPAIAETILSQLRANDALKQEVCDIVGHHHHPRPQETTNFKVLYDADRITNLAEMQKEKPIEKSKLLRVIEKSFLTENGKAIAKNILCLV
ncbi:MAG: HD domain-containing protein [Candidatus Magnetomorum sp.]|nr:HD domain-containing protein [Candidatus Magnetomorum sp.]